MSKGKVLNEREFETDYELENGTIITIILDKDYSKISFQNKSNDKIYKDHFEFIDKDENGKSYLLAYMYVPFKEQGLGRAALELFIRVSHANVWARENDGQQYDDGSHLTGDAPFFVDKMIEAGLLSPQNDHNWED